MAYSYPAYGGYNAAGAFHAQPMSFYQPIPQTPPAQPQAANQPSFSVRLVTTRDNVGEELCILGGAATTL